MAVILCLLHHRVLLWKCSTVSGRGYAWLHRRPPHSTQVVAVATAALLHEAALFPPAPAKRGRGFVLLAARFLSAAVQSQSCCEPKPPDGSIRLGCPLQGCEHGGLGGGPAQPPAPARAGSTPQSSSVPVLLCAPFNFHIGARAFPQPCRSPGRGGKRAAGFGEQNGQTVRTKPREMWGPAGRTKVSGETALGPWSTLLPRPEAGEETGLFPSAEVELQIFFFHPTN